MKTGRAPAPPNEPYGPLIEGKGVCLGYAETFRLLMDMAGVEFENTEVVAMITDGEEAGLRGAKAYAKAHKDEFTGNDVETVVLCCDTLTDLEYLKCLCKGYDGNS